MPPDGSDSDSPSSSSEEGIELTANPLRDGSSQEHRRDREEGKGIVLERRSRHNARKTDSDSDEETGLPFLPKSPEKQATVKALADAQSSRRTLVREAVAWTRADYATIFALATVTTSVIGFQVLCVSDQQCLPQEGFDPAAPPSYALKSILPGLCVATFLSLVFVLDVAYSSRGIEAFLREQKTSRAKEVPETLVKQLLDGFRRKTFIAAVLTSVAGVLFGLAAMERGAHLHSGFKKTARRIFDNCDDEGWQRERGQCDYSNSVNVYYDIHQNLADKAKSNLEHLITFYAILAFLLVASALALLGALGVVFLLGDRRSEVFFSDDNRFFSSCFFGLDCLRVRPRLFSHSS